MKGHGSLRTEVSSRRINIPTTSADAKQIQPFWIHYLSFWDNSLFRRLGEIWVVVSNIFYFQPYLGKWSNLTDIFEMGWNHQPVLFRRLGEIHFVPQSLNHTARYDPHVKKASMYLYFLCTHMFIHMHSKRNTCMYICLSFYFHRHNVDTTKSLFYTCILSIY